MQTTDRVLVVFFACLVGPDFDYLMGESYKIERRNSF